MFFLLERLSIYSNKNKSVPHGPMENVFLGLHAASVDSPVPKPVTCPNLQIVEVEGERTEAAYAALRECFLNCADHGAVLQELDLRSLRSANDLSAAVVRGYVDILTKDVGHVHSAPDESGEGESN